MNTPTKWYLALVVATATATLATACTDRYRNPADDPANQTTTTTPTQDEP